MNKLFCESFLTPRGQIAWVFNCRSLNLDRATCSTGVLRLFYRRASPTATTNFTLTLLEWLSVDRGWVALPCMQPRSFYRLARHLAQHETRDIGTCSGMCAWWMHTVWGAHTRTGYQYCFYISKYKYDFRVCVDTWVWKYGLSTLYL